MIIKLTFKIINIGYIHTNMEGLIRIVKICSVCRPYFFPRRFGYEWPPIFYIKINDYN